MANTAFEVVQEALVAEKARSQKRLDVLSSFKVNVDRQSSVLEGLTSRLLPAFKNSLGQFSSKGGYSETELRAALRDNLEVSLSNTAGVAGLSEAEISANTDDLSVRTQEAANNFHAALLADPLNAFVLPRISYDNMSTVNVTRAEAINEATEVVGLIKLMHDVIPPEYYAQTSLANLETARSQLEEISRQLTIACTAVASGENPDKLVDATENDFEAVIRFLAQESIYDASQFSPTEYLDLVRRALSAADALEQTGTSLSTAKQNMLNYQTNFIAEFGNQFSECGTISGAQGLIEVAIGRIDTLLDPSLESAELKSIEATREIVLQLTIALTLLQSLVRQKASIEDALLVRTSDERTLFEGSQTAMSSVPAFDSALPDQLRSFARLAERRLTSPTSSSQVGSLYASLSASLPSEFTKSETLQASLNGYAIDVTDTDKSFVMSAVQDIRDLGLDRLLDAILTGDLTTVFDENISKAARIGYAIQEVALALEGAVSGISLALGGCKISSRFSRKRLSTMLTEMQEILQVRAYAQINIKDFINRRIRDITDNKLKRLSRYIEEVGTISRTEGCS